MVKKSVCLGLLVLFLLSTSAFAGGSGNCIQPLNTTTESLGLGVGFGYNYVSNRLYDLYTFDRDEEDIKIKDMSQAYGIIPVGSGDNHNVIVRIGACDYKVQFKDTESSGNNIVRTEVENGIYGGVGINSLFPLKEVDVPFIGLFNIGWGYEIQANAFFNEIKDISTDAGTATNVKPRDTFGADGQESIYLTARYDIEAVETSIIPYIGAYHSWIVFGLYEGLEYSEANGDTEESYIPAAFDALSFGVLLGVDVEIAKYVNMNVEGRFVGETAVTTGVTVKF